MRSARSNRIPDKGEARNSLARAIFFYRRGAVRDRLREDPQNKASGLNLVVGAIVLWNIVYLEQAVAALERQGTPMPADCFPHLSPLGWEHTIRALFGISIEFPMPIPVPGCA
jgi:hypothetical protein